jgi:hypothetical protein
MPTDHNEIERLAECGFCHGNWCARGLCPVCGSPEIVAARAALKAKEQNDG